MDKTLQSKVEYQLGHPIPDTYGWNKFKALSGIGAAPAVQSFAKQIADICIGAEWPEAIPAIFNDGKLNATYATQDIISKLQVRMQEVLNGPRPVKKAPPKKVPATHTIIVSPGITPRIRPSSNGNGPPPGTAQRGIGLPSRQAQP